MRGVWVVAAVFACTLASGSVAGRAQVTPAGPEFRVNTYNASAQRVPAVCRTGGGDIVVWQSDGQDGRGWGIFGQRLTAAGTPRGNEFRVPTSILNAQAHPAIACAGDGRFVVVWDSDHGGHVRGVFGQQFDADGVPFGNEFRINEDTGSDSVLSAVCGDEDGDFVVVWQAYQPLSRQDVFAQRFVSSGGMLGAPFRVNTYTESTQGRPAVACAADGSFVIVWDSDVQDGSDFGIFGQRYDSQGLAAGFEFQVNSTALGNQHHPRIAVSRDGDFVVAWEGRAADATHYAIHAQRFDRQGVLRGTEFAVDAVRSGSQYRPAIAADADGDFVVVWANDQRGRPISARRYASNGRPIGGAIHAGDPVTGARGPAVAITANGDFVLVWEALDQDGDNGIWARRFATCGNGNVDPGEECDDGNAHDDDCCRADCAFAVRPSLEGDERVCRAIDAEALTCEALAAAKREPCDDHNACTTGDFCSYGVCVGDGVLACDDDNPCTTDTCHPASGCLNPPNRARCDDGNACTGADTCRNGVCVAGPRVDCDDADICTDDACDPRRGCTHAGNRARCEDGDACTTGDRCDAGRCRAGAARDCDDDNTCTDDACAPLAGCTHTASAAGCDDGNPCSSGDTCIAGVCLASGRSSCDDGNACTDDWCQPGSGCLHTGHGGTCDDGNACTRSDRCAGDTCQGTAPVICVAVDACHDTGVCDSATGACSSPPKTEGAVCDDGDVCSVGDRCREGACRPGASGLPFLVKDIRRGSGSSFPTELVDVGGTLYFRAHDGSSGRELWASDGTPAGTRLVADLWLGSEGSSPAALTAVADANGAAAAGVLFFTAEQPDTGRELWITDGSPSGTRLVSDIHPSGGSDPAALVADNGRVFFVADDGAHGREPWVSDGTPAGTRLIVDLRPGHCGAAPCSSAPGELTPAGGQLFFVARDDAHGTELWRSDGSEGGTQLVADVRPGAASSDPAFLTSMDSLLYFAADDGTHGRELWCTAGTAESTTLIKDIRPERCGNGPCSASPSYLAVARGALLFGVSRPDAELWRSDGTEQGTVRISTIPALPYLHHATEQGLFFAVRDGGAGAALWSSDGSAGGTRRVAAATARTAAGLPAWLSSLDTNLFFSAATGTDSSVLWRTNGTAAGTQPVHDVVRNGNGSSPHPSSPASLTRAGGRLFFSAEDPHNGRELWALCR